MRVTALAGAESAPFLRALAGALAPGSLTVVTPVTRDQWVHGLKRSPDLDAVLDALRPVAAGPATYAAAAELAALGAEPSWARDDDATIARQVLRTELLGAGYPLGDVATAMALRLGLTATVLPVTDARAELHVVVPGPDGRRAVHVEEHLASGEQAEGLVVVAEDASASPAALAAVAEADVVVLAPLRPGTSRTPLLRTGGLVEALSARTAPLLGAGDVTDPLAAFADPLGLTVVPATDVADVVAAATR